MRVLSVLMSLMIVSCSTQKTALHSSQGSSRKIASIINEGKNLSSFILNHDISINGTKAKVVQNHGKYDISQDSKGNEEYTVELPATLTDRKRVKYKLKVKKEKGRVRKIFEFHNNSLEESTVRKFLSAVFGSYNTKYDIRVANLTSQQKLISFTRCYVGGDYTDTFLHQKGYTCKTITPAICHNLLKFVKDKEKFMAKTKSCEEHIELSNKALKLYFNDLNTKKNKEMRQKNIQYLKKEFKNLHPKFLGIVKTNFMRFRWNESKKGTFPYATTQLNNLVKDCGNIIDYVPHRFIKSSSQRKASSKTRQR